MALLSTAQNQRQKKACGRRSKSAPTWSADALRLYNHWHFGKLRKYSASAADRHPLVEKNLQGAPHRHPADDQHALSEKYPKRCHCRRKMPVPVAGGSLDRGDENEPGRRSAAKLLTKDEARRLLFRDGRIAPAHRPGLLVLLHAVASCVAE